jgi:hypothetical protein
MRYERPDRGELHRLNLLNSFKLAASGLVF